MPCNRCGGALYRQVDYCPYCGAVHPLDTGPHKRTVIPGSRASAMSRPAHNSGFDPAAPGEAELAAPVARVGAAAPAGVALHASIAVSPDTPIPPLAGPLHSNGRAGLRVRRLLLAIVTVVGIGLVYVGYALFSDSHESRNGDNGQLAETNQDARTTTGTIALYAPAQSANQAAAVKPANSGNAAKAAPAIPATSVTPPALEAPVKPATPRFGDADQAMRAARLAFRANDLSAAQAALGAAQTLRPENTDAQNLAAELRPLTARRDTALQAAQLCATQQSWTCARQHADEALAIDTGNETAKTILLRVIRETGWKPLNPRAATGGPAQAQAASPSPLSSQQAQLQTPLPKGIPANSQAFAATPPAGAAALDTNSIEARERAIKASGWNRASASGANPSASVRPSGSE